MHSIYPHITLYTTQWQETRQQWQEIMSMRRTSDERWYDHSRRSTKESMLGANLCICHRKLKRFWKSNARLRERLEGDRTRALVAQGAQVNSLQSGEDESWWWRMVVWWRTICASMWVMTQHLNHPKLLLYCLLGGVMCFMCSVWCGSTNSKIAWVLRSIARIPDQPCTKSQPQGRTLVPDHCGQY